MANKEKQNSKKEFDGYAYWMDGDSFGGAWFICDTLEEAITASNPGDSIYKVTGVYVGKKSEPYLDRSERDD